jgi:hypothetical protein
MWCLNIAVSDATKATVFVTVDRGISRKRRNDIARPSERQASDELLYVYSKLHESRRNKMLKKMLIVVAMSAVSVLAVAGESEARSAAKQTIEMQDGSIVYVFKSGKMAVENKMGHAVSTKAGTVMKAKDGSNVTMVGNEISELDGLLKQGETNDSQEGSPK